MRLKQIIESSADIMGDSDSADIDDFNEVIQKECKPYLKLISQSKEPLYRGIAGVYADSWGSKKTRTDRRTRMMNKIVADYLNGWLQKNGHARRDKAVICSPRDETLRLFGPSFYIFPAGKIKYTYVESEDINFVNSESGWGGTTSPDAFWGFHNDGPNAYMDDSTLRKMKQPFKNYFHSNNFKKGYNKGYEFWIECSHYYFAPLDEFVWDDKYKALV
jgi:hypothetical protein